MASLEERRCWFTGKLQQLLTTHAAGDPYGMDGTFAANLATLSPGLRAMAATHWLDRFVEARNLMIPLLTHRTEADGDPYEILEHTGYDREGREIDERASALSNVAEDESAIYDAWIRYTRTYPERVFAPVAKAD